jgi:hypothetical protein
MALLPSAGSALHWSEMPIVEACQRVFEIQQRYRRDYSWRRARARRLAGLYHGRSLDEQYARDARFSWRNDVMDAEVPLLRNKAYEYVETYVSKIGAVDAPKPALMVTDGDWELKRRVTVSGRLLEAEYDMRQGLYANVYALAHQGLRVAAAATGSIAAKVYPWPNEKRIVIELHDTLDMFLDDTELLYGAPQTYGEVTWWPPHQLQHRFPGQADKIALAVEPMEDAPLSFSGLVKRAELVPVWEAWSMKRGDKPGRRIAFLRGETVLEDVEWDSDEPPFAILHTSPQLCGFWSTPMMDIVYEEVIRANEILFRCDEAEFDTPKQTHYVHEGSISNIDELLQVDTITVVRTKNPNYVPSVHTPAPFDRIALDLLHEHEGGIARALGIDEMHSAAKKEPGLESGVAQREAAARFDNRFAATHRAFTQWVAVDLARHILKAQKALYEQGGAFKRRWSGEYFSKNIEAGDIVDLEKDNLMLQVKPISETKNTPEERVQYASELLDKGAITIEAYIQVLQHYDTPGETKVIKTQRRWVAWQIDQWLMASDKEVQEPGFYQGPRPWMRKVDAMVQVIDALWEAEINQVPQDRIDFFLSFIAELSEAMAAEQPQPTVVPTTALPGQQQGAVPGLGGPASAAPPPGAPGPAGAPLPPGPIPVA